MTDIDRKTARVTWEHRNDRLYKYVNGRLYGWYETTPDGFKVWWYA